MKLSDRLSMSAGMVTPGGTVADVGCDHAHTCIYLLEQGLADRCLAMDVRKGPLEKALANLRLYDCLDRTEVRLSYGLDELTPGEADSIIISGMGGLLIADILGRGLETARAAGELILQPQSHIYELRSFLFDHGFLITDEDMCFEEDKYYTSMHVIPHKEEGDKSELELEFGPVLLKKRHPVLKSYLEAERGKVTHRLAQLESGRTEDAQAKRGYFGKRLALIDQALLLFGGANG